MWPVVGIFLGFYGWMNLRIIPALESGGPAATVFEDRVEQILPLVPEGSYNLALLSGSKDYRGMNYRYFFEVSTHPPLSEDNYTDAEFFVLIDEDGVENPTSHPAYEIAAYRLAEEDMIGSVLLKGKVRVMVYQTHIGESRLQ
jgi:hypothetical protein